MDDDRRDDADLVARSAGGSEVAFRTLYRAYATAVFRVAYGLLGDVHDAEDVTQETFVTAWRKIGGLRLESDSALPWLATICRFHAANRRRARLRRHDTAPLDDTLPARTDVEHDVIRLELVDAIAREVSGLSALDREVFALCIGEGLSYQEAARRLGVAHGAVRNRLSRIRGRLRARVTTEETS